MRDLKKIVCLMFCGIFFQSSFLIYSMRYIYIYMIEGIPGLVITARFILYTILESIRVSRKLV